MKLQTKCSKHRQKEINPAGGVKVRNEPGDRSTFGRLKIPTQPLNLERKPEQPGLYHVTALLAARDWSRADQLTQPSQSELSPENGTGWNSKRCELGTCE